MRGIPLKIAIGVVRENDELSFVGGPVDAVKAKTDTYVVVAPGDSTGKALFKRVLKVFAGKKPKKLREKILKTSVEEIRGYMPYGKGRILESQI